MCEIKVQRTSGREATQAILGSLECNEDSDDDDDFERYIFVLKEITTKKR